MLLFNIFSLQFTAMFSLFYKSAGTRSIKFFLAPVEIFAHFAVTHLHRFFKLNVSKWFALWSEQIKITWS